MKFDFQTFVHPPPLSLSLSGLGESEIRVVVHSPFRCDSAWRFSIDNWVMEMVDNRGDDGTHSWPMNRLRDRYF